MEEDGRQNWRDEVHPGGELVDVNGIKVIRVSEPGDHEGVYLNDRPIVGKAKEDDMTWSITRFFSSVQTSASGASSSTPTRKRANSPRAAASW